MNYFSHYLLVPDKLDHQFVLGNIMPDLLRDSKIDASLLKEHSSISKGIHFHLQVDKRFHNSPFFKHYTSSISRDIRSNSSISISKYTYFLAHIMLEFFIDHILVNEYEEQIDAFYKSLTKVDQEIMENFFNSYLLNHDFELFCEKLTNFASRKFIYNYKNSITIGKVSSIVFNKVGIAPISQEDQVLLSELIVANYQSSIESDLPQLLKEIV